MPVSINGTTGVESPGYSQDGDPIVESGTNADGYWVRFANGTQIVKGVNTVDLSVSTFQTFDMPMPFFDVPGGSISCSVFSPSSDELDALQGITLICNTTQWRTPVRDVLAPGGSTATLMLSAFGRWK